MALTITQLGSEIATEKLVLSALTDAPAGQILSVIMDIYINDTVIAHTLEHLPVLGTDNTFNFEINSIVKDYFASEFIPLTGVNQTVIENAIVNATFREVEITGVGVLSYNHDLVIKNITQDTFEIEDFDLLDYDCGDLGTTASKFLTSSPSPLPIGDLTSVHVSCLTTSYNALVPKQEWQIQTLLNGVLVATTTENVDVPTRDLSPFVAGGKYDIATYRFDFASSTGIDEVRILIRDIASPFTTRSETKVFKLNDSCERDITLSWLNEFGAQDTFTFLGNITRTGKYTDSTFKRTRPVNPVSTDVGDLVYKSSYNYEYDIFSDRMPETHVQWLSKILINKRAAIQESPTSKQNTSYLYNFFVINNGISGDGRAVGGIVNTSIPVWAVASQADFTTLETFLGVTAGGEMKEAGFTNWDSPNTGATNSSGFTALGHGGRDSGGTFLTGGTSWICWTYDLGASPSFNNTKIISNSSSGLGGLTTANEDGHNIRLVRPAVGGETNGQILKANYIGNNGQRYDGIVIGTQVWITADLRETRYNNNTGIALVEDNTAWSNLTTGGYSVYDNQFTLLTKGTKYFPIVITTEDTVLSDKFTPETLFRLKFRLANRRKGLK